MTENAIFNPNPSSLSIGKIQKWNNSQQNKIFRYSIKTILITLGKLYSFLFV